MKGQAQVRGQYGEILLSSLSLPTRKSVRKLVDDIARSEKVDEHGNWEFGCDFDNKRRGHATNWDLYCVGRDHHSKKLLAVIQVRQYIKQHKNWWPQVRKNYFLCGRNEDNTAFAHPLPAQVVRAACRKAKPLLAIQTWIFGGDYTKMRRQGDFALIPVKRPSVGAVDQSPTRIMQRSHYLIADKVVQNGQLYAKNPSLYHLPATHPDLENLPGWYRVIEGKRGSFWSFSAPTID